MSQLELNFAPPACCPNCDPARDAENLLVLSACGKPWLQKNLEALRMPFDPEDALHRSRRADLFERALARAA